MTLLDANDLYQMRADYDASLPDTCTIGVHTVTTADDGQDVETWPHGDTEACAFQPTAGAEQRRADLTVLTYDARLRLRRGASVTYLDHIILTHRWGTILATPMEFAIEGDPQIGPAGMVLLLKRVST